METDEKTCPDCAEQVKAAARICRFCGYDFTSGSPGALAAARAAQALGDPAPAAAEPSPVPPERQDEAADQAQADRFVRNSLLAAGGGIALLLLIGVSVRPGSDGPAASTGTDLNMMASDPMDVGMDADVNAMGDLGNSALDAGAAPPAPSTGWTYRSSDDAVRGKPIRFATVTSGNSVFFGSPYGEARLEIVVRKHPEWGQDVMFQVTDGQYTCGIDDCRGMIRFDGEVEKLTLNQPADHNPRTLFAAYPAPMIDKLKRAKKVVVELPFYQEGNRQFSFDTAGLQWPPKGE